MVISLAIEPVSAGTTNMMEHRYRPAMGERPILPDSTPKSADSQRPGDRRPDTPFGREEPEAELPADPPRNRASDFAAAVIAGALPPTPKSMDELFRRIGATEIPEESQARLKNLIA